MSLVGMDFRELSELAKKFNENREFLGITKEQAAKMLGIPISEINYLETFANVMPDTVTIPREVIEKVKAALAELDSYREGFPDHEAHHELCCQVPTLASEILTLLEGV